MKNTVKTIVRIIFVASFSLLSNIHAITITYRQAQQKDIKQIAKLYNGMDNKSKKRLVILPEEVMPDYIKENIDQGKIFVACNADKVIAFIKLYIIDSKDLIDILQNEISCFGRNAELEESCCYTINSHNDPLTIKPYISTQSFTIQSNTLFLYYGGAYTLKNHRSKGINTKLQRYGYKHIMKAIKQKLDRVVLLYGQVTANKTNKTPIKVFAESMGLLTKNTIFPINHYCYKAYMPTFELKNGKTIKKDDTEAYRGQGNILEFTLN